MQFSLKPTDRQDKFLLLAMFILYLYLSHELTIARATVALKGERQGNGSLAASRSLASYVDLQSS